MLSTLNCSPYHIDLLNKDPLQFSVTGGPTETHGVVLAYLLETALQDKDHTWQDIRYFFSDTTNGFYLCNNVGAYVHTYTPPQEEIWTVFIDDDNSETKSCQINGTLLRCVFITAVSLYYDIEVT